MPSCCDAFLRSRGFALLDGGLATELEAAGHELNDPLWSAKVLIEDPGAIEAVHLAYLRAGADCVISATYQASFEGLAVRGVGRREAEGLMRLAVEVAARARDGFWGEAGAQASPARRDCGSATDRVAGGLEEASAADDAFRPLVAASVGPYGAFLADGSEYRGRYGAAPDALARFHRDRLRLLAATDADLLACETIPSFAEARVLAELVADLTDKPAWFTFTCRSEAELSDGTPMGEVADWADQAAGVHAVGVNCTPAGLLPALIRALRARTAKPVVAYPNGGGEWDASTKTWGKGDAELDWGEAARNWIAAGASMVGGCCRVGPDAIRAMRAALNTAPRRQPA